MTIARIQSFAFSGIEAVPVEVQVQISPGVPAFLVVGLPDKAVGEARERVRAALTAMGLSLPPKRVLINLAPADLLKEGSHFDLPIALAVLAAMDVLPREEMGEFAAVGELSLDGTLNPVAGVLPAAMAANGRELGLVCPAAQGGEAAWAGAQFPVLAAPDLLALVNHFRGSQVLSPPAAAGLAEGPALPDLAEVRALFDGACAAVAVAHRMRALAGAPVLHGLLSPESVLLSRGAGAGRWDVCVMDFALSTLPGVAWSPAPTSLMSDPRAPEQLAVGGDDGCVRIWRAAGQGAAMPNTAPGAMPTALDAAPARSSAARRYLSAAGAGRKMSSSINRSPPP